MSEAPRTVGERTVGEEFSVRDKWYVVPEVTAEGRVRVSAIDAPTQRQIESKSDFEDRRIEDEIAAGLLPHPDGPEPGTVAACLNDERVRQGLTIEALAARAGIDGRELTEMLYCRGRAVTPGAWQQIAAAMDRRLRHSLVEPQIEGAAADHALPST